MERTRKLTLGTHICHQLMPTEKQGLQAYNYKELDFDDTLDEL